MRSFKDADRASYELVARAWDAHSERLSGRYAPTLLRMAGVTPGQRVLEVCCGTGVLSRAAAREVGPSGSVLGTDLTPGMVAAAAAAAVERRLSNAAFRVMDCEALELPGDAFDAGLAMYPHFGDHRRALAELCRVVRPGGRVAIAVGGGLGRPGAPRPIPVTLRIMIELVQRRRPDEPVGHPPGWAGPDPVVGLPAALAEAGFVEVTTAVETHPTHLAGPDEAWDVWSMTATPVRHRLAELDPGEREAVRREFLDAFGPLANAATLTRMTGAVFGAGRRPGS